ncbi:MAG TPA: trehalose-6-phosphate synthase [Myxococcales bacterium]|nr:trehalose-6-phosphate synthase [Myxococcales bacterium]
MQTALRYALPIVFGLALFTLGSYLVVSTTSRSWFEDDVRRRAELAIRGAGDALSQSWARGDRVSVRRVLDDITRDERILAAAACAPDGSVFAQTADFPRSLPCSRFVARSLGNGQARTWNRAERVDGASVYLSALPVLSPGSVPLGAVGLIHDMSYAEERDALTRRAALGLFGVLAVSAIVLSTASARGSLRRFRNDLRNLVRGERSRGEFQPLLQDVRDLAAQLSPVNRAEETGRAWNPERLREVLHEHLQGEKVVIVANREPYIHDRDEHGALRVLHPASGLVTALEPVMRACSGVWVAHGSGPADRETSDKQGRIRVPPKEESYTLRRVWLTAEEEQGYYYGFSNEGLWPLCHMAHARPTFRDEDFAHYKRVNERFAEAVVSEVDRQDPIILVQDYHFALAPRLIRERLPRATILTFWHIPWPNPEQFGICPFREEVLQGLLGSSIVGFHVQAHCNNFVDSVDRYLEARIDRERIGIIHSGETTLVRPYPISIEWPNHWAQESPPAAACRKEVFAELGLKADALLGVGVDRLDYTKGIEERLLAVEQLLARFPQFQGRFTFVQLAAPSRTAIERYQQLNLNVESLAKRINERFGSADYRPVILQRQHHEPPRVFRYLRAADLCYVSSLHDGMNLVAKEFVAARDDERGVLVLSQFTGAARELTEALVVNPYDLKQASRALAAALTMRPQEQTERMRALRSLVSEFNVYRWAGRMLADAARLRQRDRLSQRLGGLASVEGAA